MTNLTQLSARLKNFKGLVVGFRPKGMPGKMCDSVRWKWGHTSVQVTFSVMYYGAELFMESHLWYWGICIQTRILIEFWSEYLMNSKPSLSAFNFNQLNSSRRSQMALEFGIILEFFMLIKNPNANHEDLGPILQSIHYDVMQFIWKSWLMTSLNGFDFEFLHNLWCAHMNKAIYCWCT